MTVKGRKAGEGAGVWGRGGGVDLFLAPSWAPSAGDTGNHTQSPDQTQSVFLREGVCVERGTNNISTQEEPHLSSPSNAACLWGETCCAGFANGKLRFRELINFTQGKN